MRREKNVTKNEELSSKQNLPAVSCGECAKTPSVYTDPLGVKAVIPNGWTVSGIPEENTVCNGMVIYRIPSQETVDWSDSRIQEIYDQFVYVPEFRGKGDFYISRYDICLGVKSVKGQYPLVNIDFLDAREIGERYNEISYLPFGGEYEAISRWLRREGVKTRKELEEDSSEWGIYLNTVGTYPLLAKTGSREKYYVNNIADLAGNVKEWTQEVFEDWGEYGEYRLVRGGGFSDRGDEYPALKKTAVLSYSVSFKLGLRIAMKVK